MTNEDLKRFYAGQGKTPKDFVRLNSSGKIPDNNIPNDVAKLNAQGKIPADNLPSYVDDVVDGYYYNSKFWEDNAHTKEITGEAGKIYLDLSTNDVYRWAAVEFVLVGDKSIYRHKIEFKPKDAMQIYNNLLYTFYWYSSSPTVLTADTVISALNSFANQSDIGVATVSDPNAVLSNVTLIPFAKLSLGDNTDFKVFTLYYNKTNNTGFVPDTRTITDSTGFVEFTDTVTAL